MLCVTYTVCVSTLFVALIVIAGAILIESMKQSRVRDRVRATGLMIVTGPPSHGKTTSVYASIAPYLNPPKRRFTIETPVEYAFAHGGRIRA